MKIESSAFEQNQTIPEKYTCDGEDIAPPLIISGISKEAKSIVLIMDDPDSPSGTWTHWTIWNIPATEKIIIDGSLPEGAIEGVTSFGRLGYGGPCPASGEHRYFFKVYALDSFLNVSSDSIAKEIERACVGHIIDKAGLVGTYKRK